MKQSTWPPRAPRYPVDEGDTCHFHRKKAAVTRMRIGEPVTELRAVCADCADEIDGGY